MQETRSKRQENEEADDKNLASSTLPLASKSPQRKCLVSGESFDKENLLRFVRAPDGTLTFDVNGKLPGRGAYVTPTADALKTALKKNLFAKSFKDGTKVPADMATLVTQQIRAAALQYLALARRAGQAVAGAEKCGDFIRRHAPAAIVQASDAGRDGQQTARGLAHDKPIVTEFTRDELGAIFGREQAVVVAIAQSGLAKQFLSALGRLSALKGLENP
jgi:predicted RNA-binding protein YlxR (DUF448 family)